jgi:disulfide oxidoreductase YuzD
MSKDFEIKWLAEPEEKNYPAAESYLGLIYGEATVKTIMSAFQGAPVKQFKAKDIFRASGLSLLGISNYHVEKDRKKIEDEKQLSPILLVRDERNGKVIIADGYHRLCAVYSFDEDENIPCKIVQR